MYQLKLEPRVEKTLAHLALDTRRRIAAEIETLAEDPRPADCMPVRAAPRGTFRIRVGDWRVIYVVDDVDHKVTIARVARRKGDTYRRLR